MDFGEVPDITRDEHPPVQRGHAKDLFVGEPTEILPLDGGDHIVPAPT